jgi:hypothetical protein
MLVFETIDFMFSIVNSTFKTIDFLDYLILNQDRNVDIMKKHGFYFVSIVFWLFDILTIF